MVLGESGVLSKITKHVGLGFCKTCVIPTLHHLRGSNKKKLVLVRLEIHVYEWPFWRWWHRFDAFRNAILHELLFVVTRRSYILRSEISKLILNFLFINSFHACNMFIAHHVSLVREHLLVLL